MAKKLLVREPQTTDGINLAYDDDKQVIYNESYAEPGAKANLDSINARMPKHLRSDITEVEVELDRFGNVIVPKAHESAPAQKEKAEDVIEKIKAATTKEEVEELVKNDDRKTVKDAGTKKLSEL